MLNSDNLQVDEIDSWSLLMDEMNGSPDEAALDAEQVRNSISDDLINLDQNFSVDMEMSHAFRKCNKCDVEYIMGDGYVYCDNCGEEKQLISDTENYCSITQDHNTSDNSFMSFKIIGKGAYCYQRSFLKCCADYATYRKNNNKKDMFNYIYQ